MNEFEREGRYGIFFPSSQAIFSESPRIAAGVDSLPPSEKAQDSRAREG